MRRALAGKQHHGVVPGPTPIKRPSGVYFVVAGRTGVETGGGCALAFPLWAITRLRWQFGPRSWSVEVSAPWTLNRWNAHLRRLEQWTFESRREAEAFIPEVVERVRRGEFDSA